MTPAQVARAKNLLELAKSSKPFEFSREYEDGTTIDDIAIYQDSNGWTVLHHLVAEKKWASAAYFVKCINKVTLSKFFTLTVESNFLGLISDSRINQDDTVTKEFMNFFTRVLDNMDPGIFARELFCDKEPALMKLVQIKFEPDIMKKMLELVRRDDLLNAIKRCDLISVISDDWLPLLDFIQPNDVLFDQLMRYSEVKSSPTFGNDHGNQDAPKATYVRKLPVETMSPAKFAAFEKRGMKLDLIYKNLFEVEAHKLSASLYESVSTSHSGRFFAPIILPAALVMTTVEKLTGTRGVNWTVAPEKVNPELQEIMALKLWEMEYAWVDQDTKFDLEKIAEFKKICPATTERTKHQESVVYRLFAECSKQGGSKAEAALKHIQRCAANHNPAAAAVRLAQLEQKPQLTEEDLKEIAVIAEGIPTAAMKLANHYSKNSSFWNTFPKEVFMLLVKHQWNMDCAYQIGLCYEQGLGVERNWSFALDYFFRASKESEKAGRKLQVIFDQLPADNPHYLNALICLTAYKQVISPEYIEAVQTQTNFLMSHLLQTCELRTNDQNRLLLTAFVDNCPDTSYAKNAMQKQIARYFPREEAASLGL